MLDKFGEPVSAYDLNELGGFRKSYAQLLSELKNNPSGKPYDLGFQAELSRARMREIKNLENSLDNANN